MINRGENTVEEIGKDVEVLLIDDDENVYSYINKILEKYTKDKVNLTWVGSLSLAYDQIKEHDYDAYFVDYFIGEELGTSFISEISKGDGNKPTILITSHDDDAVVEEALEAGATDFCIKSKLDPKSLIRSLHYSLKQKEIHQLLSSSKSAISRLFAGVSHEINNPLSAIQSNVEAIEESHFFGLSELFEIFSLFSSEEVAQVQQIVERNAIFAPNTDFKILFKNKKLFYQLLTESGISNARKLSILLSDLRFKESQVRQLLPFLAKENSFELLSYIDQQRKLWRNIENIHLSVSYASKMVFALQNFSRNSLSGKPVRLDLNESLKKVLRIYFTKFKQNISVLTSFCENAFIRGVHVELEQLWSNILVNAEQSIVGQGKITISTRIEGLFVVIKVEDTGCGIPKENFHRVFKPFFSSKPEGQGTGLGLDVSKKIVERHNGKITFESVVNKGTTFIIHFPIVEQREGNENLSN